MEQKVIYAVLPYSTNWRLILKDMEINESKHFQNLNNSLYNARCAIKRYYEKARNGKLPYRRFCTATNRADQSFSITRIE